MDKLLKRWTARLARDKGVAGIVIAIIIMVAAFTAFTVFVSQRTGPVRDLARLQNASSPMRVLQSAIFANYFQTSSPRVLPCPDTNQDGTQDCTDTTDTAAGTIPWITLGISRDDVIDPYGRFYTYVVLATSSARELCESQQNDYAPSQVEYTGAVKDQTTLEVRLTSESAGDGRYVPFAIISHGENGLGGISSSGTTMAAAASGSYEETNALDAGPTVVYSGPQNTTDGSIFDDAVFAPTAADVQKTCEDLTPSGGKNVALTENFNDTTSTTIDTAKFDASSTDAPTQSNGVANFTTSNSYLATETTYDFTANVEPVYVSALWTPGATTSGFSIATRATLSPTGDDFTTGLTFRFDNRTGTTSGASPGVSNTISIRADSAAITTTGADPTINIITSQQYLLEVYDNGSTVWMRITRVSAPTNAATIQGTNTSDLTGDQRVVFINGAGASTIDDLNVGVPMLSLQTGPTSGYASSPSGQNGTTTGNLTLEAWIKPRSIPSGSAEATIISQWDTDTTATEDTSSFRLHLVGGTFAIDLQDAADTGDSETLNLGFGPTENEWMHVAVTFDRTIRAVRGYKDGVLTYTGTSTLDSNGIRAAAYSLAVGADSVNSPPVNFFYGNISDVRVWQDVRTSSEIARCFQKRLPSAAPCTTTDLIVNWKLDPTAAQEGLSETDVVATVGTAGTLTSASYGPALAAYFRPMSSETGFCPLGTRVGAYRCDFRLTTTTTTGNAWTAVQIPQNLDSVFVKVWGAGGGSYNGGPRSGGHGGFSRGLLETINGVNIANMQIKILVGGAGTGSSTTGLAAGGGAGSLIANNSDFISFVSGGGGGAGFSDSAAVNCNGATDCGMGADGATAGASNATASDGTSTCGGRGGSTGTFGGDPPTSGGHCPAGGADPTGSTSTGGVGGNGSTGAAGGTASTGTLNVAGGAGYLPASTASGQVGGGGGGGGYVGGEAGGYDSATGPRGYGGGGGSGNAATGVYGSTSTTAFSDNQCTADLTNNSVNVTITSCTSGGTDLVVRGWTTGMTIWAAGGIPGGTTIQSISGNTLVMSAQATNGSNPTVTVTGTTMAAVQSTGTSDEDYAPSTGLGQVPANYRNPGAGGTAGANGNPGAIILRW